MTIRAATTDDLPAIAEIWNEAIRSTAQTFNAREKTRPELTLLLQTRSSDGHALLVAEIEGAVCGFGTYGQFRAGVGYSFTMEHTLYLSPHARGHGLGRALLLALENHARAGGAHVLVGGLTGENPGSITFHERMGYTQVGVMPQVGHKFGRYMDLVLVQKILT